MTKNKIKQELKGMHNEVRKIDGTNIAKVSWKSYPYMIIENQETFEDAREDDFNPIMQFRTQEEVIDFFTNLKYN